MIDNHLTDIEIQEYVLDASQCTKVNLDHMQVCGHCRVKATQYKRLFAGIEGQEQAAFDFDLAALVMEKLPANKNLWDTYFEWWLAGFVLLVFVIGGYFLRTDLKALRSSLTPLIFLLILIPVLALLVFLGFDMYKAYQKKMKALNFY
ncbi:hypothetical protein [Flavihumibacter profundi]|uniref:hypothetical protein n=1 Tax=Flavihumibacter profundi TaxID=2716883 RepID=UPI001CC43865|nr:hypothetical protein [Flavihumibacter profundi]MBZ5856809.1 hypothetical protein [Flavihumibacter profundi]